MPIPGQTQEVLLDINRLAADDINQKPLSNLPEIKPIKLTKNGKLVDPTEVSIESDPLNDLKVEGEA